MTSSHTEEIMLPLIIYPLREHQPESGPGFLTRRLCGELKCSIDQDRAEPVGRIGDRRALESACRIRCWSSLTKEKTPRSARGVFYSVGEKFDQAASSASQSPR